MCEENKTLKQIYQEHEHDLHVRLMDRMAREVKLEEMNDRALAERYEEEDYYSKFDL